MSGDRLPSCWTTKSSPRRSSASPSWADRDRSPAHSRCRMRTTSPSCFRPGRFRYRCPSSSSALSMPNRPGKNSPAALALAVRVEHWPIAGSFAISRGAKTEAVVVVAELSDGRHRGRGECVPYQRYGETVEGVAAAIETITGDVARGLDREQLQSALPPGAARNALAAPEAMGQAAAKAAHRALLKVKLGGAGDGARIAAVRQAAPRAELIVDANEGWTVDDLAENLAACAEAGVTLVE